MLCWYYCSWGCRRVHVECNVVNAIFPIVRLLPMLRLLLRRWCIFFVLVPMVVMLVVDGVVVLDVVKLRVGWLLELLGVQQYVDYRC